MLRLLIRTSLSVPKILRHKAFLKDFRSVRLTDGQFEKLIDYLAVIKEAKPLPPQAQDHTLKGEWQDFRECHLGGDMLLIYWVDTANDQITLTRLGTHSELFG